MTYSLLNKIAAVSMIVFGVIACLSWLATGSSGFGFGGMFSLVSAALFGLNARRASADEGVVEPDSGLSASLSASENDINPASGAPMISQSTDVLGNPYGTDWN